MPKQRALVFRLNRNKQKSNRNSLIESIVWYVFRKFRDVLVFPVCFGLFRNSLFRLSRFYTETQFQCFDSTETNRRPTETVSREHNFGLFRNSSICFSCFDIDSKHRNKPKKFVVRFTKQTETQLKQIFFQFVSGSTKIFFGLFLAPYVLRIPLQKSASTAGCRAGGKYVRKNPSTPCSDLNKN